MTLYVYIYQIVYLCLYLCICPAENELCWKKRKLGSKLIKPQLEAGRWGSKVLTGYGSGTDYKHFLKCGWLWTLTVVIVRFLSKGMTEKKAGLE